MSPEFVLIGDPVAHSLSPAMHNALYQELGKVKWPFSRWHYSAVRCENAQDAREQINLVRTGRYRGMNITMPWKMTLSTNITNQSRRGYTDSSMNRNELIWNAQLSQSFLKGAATVSFEMYDILKQQSNISRSLTADGRSVSSYNGVTSYCMLHFIYRLNIFGGKGARERMRGRQGFGGPGPGGHRGGGRRPF